METITVQAVFQDGILRPKTRLNLPENIVVEVQVKTIAEKGGTKKTLFGAFPELEAITDDEMLEAKGLWDQSLRKQARLLKEAE